MGEMSAFPDRFVFSTFEEVERPVTPALFWRAGILPA
jgi:lipid-A-disaccharide synthase-like uncharacterized protein